MLGEDASRKEAKAFTRLIELKDYMNAYSRNSQ